jgi:hypothetical protein
MRKEKREKGRERESKEIEFSCYVDEGMVKRDPHHWTVSEEKRKRGRKNGWKVIDRKGRNDKSKERCCMQSRQKENKSITVKCEECERRNEGYETN